MFAFAIGCLARFRVGGVGRNRFLGVSPPPIDRSPWKQVSEPFVNDRGDLTHLTDQGFTGAQYLDDRMKPDSRGGCWSRTCFVGPTR